jgi:tetratricopeptide (TPR) repeat protein
MTPVESTEEELMFRSWILRSLAPAIAVLTFGLVPSVFAQTGGLTGKCTLQDGTPCVKCLVLIERQDIKGTYKVNTNKKGEYVYVGLPLGNYKITLQDTNGRTLFYITHHVGMGDPTEVNFDLAKEMAAAKQEQMQNPETQKKLQEQEKETKQFTGLKQLFDQGQALYGEKKYAEAAATFEQALPLAKDKNQVAVLSRLADSYDKARQFDKAIEDYQKVVALSPNDANVHNAMGSVYAEMGKIPEAQAEFQKSAQLDPPNAARAYYNLGAILTNSGKLDEAAAAFKKATEIDPKYADAYFLEAQALMGKATMGPDGKVVPAPGTVEALQSYLQLDPNGKYAASAQGMLQSISGAVQTEYKAEKKKKKG